MQLLFVLILIFGFAFARPQVVSGQGGPDGGLKAEITGVSIPGNRRPVVTFKIYDSRGKPLGLEDLDPNSVKFTIAALKTGKSGDRDYENYILAKVNGQDYVYKGETKKPVLAETLQSSTDQGGVFARLRPGVFTYTFKTALPSNFGQKATHVVGGEMTRDNRRFAANPLYEFVPAGGKIRVSDLADTASCNNCHDPMRAHRGTAREVGYCALCHI